MGLRDLEGLRRFCAELSNDQPSPGGGSASAASGAMAASLLAMVCGITAKSKKHEVHKEELERLRSTLVSNTNDLLALVQEDAKAYDFVVEAARKKAEDKSPSSADAFDRALEHAAEVPLKTAKACFEVLAHATRVAEIGKKSAASDVGVAILLAEAGLRGALMNVRINIAGMADQSSADTTQANADALERKAVAATKDALAKL